MLARLSSRNYTPVMPDHDLPARGKSHPINFWYGLRRNFRDGSPTAVELVFLGRRFGECCNLLLGLSLRGLGNGHLKCALSRARYSCPSPRSIAVFRKASGFRLATLKISATSSSNSSRHSLY